MAVREKKIDSSVTTIDAILDILSSETRRKILSILADEPMYFNQIARKVHVGQQAILRHMEILEKNGIIETYQEKSTLGAPNRKYYKLRKSISLSIYLSMDSFSVIIKEITQEIRNNKIRKGTSKLRQNVDSMAIHNSQSLPDVKKTLIEVEDKIRALEEKLDRLRAFKQKILGDLHATFREDKFNSLERNIIYKVIRNSPDNLEDLSDLLEESMKDTNDAIYSLYDKLNSTDAKTFLEKYRRGKERVKNRQQ